jgi:hypothetical protein
METVKWNYFQFRKNHEYLVYIRIQQEELKSKFSHIYNELGFTLLSDAESKKIPIHKSQTKILTIQPASSRLEQVINGSDLMDKYGAESLAIQAGMPTYTFRKVGMIGFPAHRNLWDLALNSDLTHTDQMIGLRIMLIRFIAQALSDQGVLCYWGIVKDESVIIMKQAQSFGESVIIDVNKRVIFSFGGELKLTSSLKIIRRDKEMKTAAVMTREDLIGFLSVSTCLLSFTSMSATMKKAIYDLSLSSSGAYAVNESMMNL